MLLTRKHLLVRHASPHVLRRRWSSSLVRGLDGGVRRPIADDGPAQLPAPLRASASASASPRPQLTLVRKVACGRRAEAAAAAGASAIQVQRTVCGHCSVGCAVDAVVENGVWVRQEPVFDSPINLGAHCAKGAALREHGHGEYRLQYADEAGRRQVPEASAGTRRSTRSAPEDARAPHRQSGPDSIFIVGSCKHNNEQAYLLRKWVSLWGTNNCDHQARICHSHHGRRRRQHLGLRRDDQFLQRHAERQGGDLHRQQRRRGAPGVDAAHAARQGERAAR